MISETTCKWKVQIAKSNCKVYSYEQIHLKLKLTGIIFPPENALSYLLSWDLLLWEDWREDGVMGKQESEQVTTHTPIVPGNHNESFL